MANPGAVRHVYLPLRPFCFVLLALAGCGGEPPTAQDDLGPSAEALVTAGGMAEIRCHGRRFDNGGDLGTPTELRATSSGNRVDLEWADHSISETHFEVQRREPSSVWQTVGLTAANTQYFSDYVYLSGTALGTSRTYTYQVRAVGGSCASQFSYVASLEEHR